MPPGGWRSLRTISDSAGSGRHGEGHRQWISAGTRGRAAEGDGRHLGFVGSRLLNGLHSLHSEHPDLIIGVAGVPEMCFLQYTDDVVSQAVTAECARAGVLFKRSAYNFVSLAHDAAVIDGTLQVLGEALSAVAKTA